MSESSQPGLSDATPDPSRTAPMPTPRQIKQWRRYLANERAEAAVYRELARRKSGTEAEILHRLADSEYRHEEYWRTKLGEHVGLPQKPDWETRFNAWMARRFGSVFTLALMQAAESRTPYVDDADAPEMMAADERIHAEVVRALGKQGREQMSGSFRAAVFGANDGLVSNLSLVLGVLGSGMNPSMVLVTGIAGLLSGALSMAAGEYVSVKSQTELLEASRPEGTTEAVVRLLDINANELELVYRARGMSAEEAKREAARTLSDVTLLSRGDTAGVATGEAADGAVVPHAAVDEGVHEPDGAWAAARSSFLAFGGGALIPVVPFFFDISLGLGALLAVLLVSVALLATGGVTGVLSGKPPLMRALRQLAIGLGAAAITFGLGRLFGAALT